jgi:hypothetical protein
MDRSPAFLEKALAANRRQDLFSSAKTSAPKGGRPKGAGLLAYWLIGLLVSRALGNVKYQIIKPIEYKILWYWFSNHGTNKKLAGIELEAR